MKLLQDGLTALIAASFNGRDDVVKLLVEKKADLHLASNVLFFICVSVDFVSPMQDGTLPLTTASLVGRAPTVSVLLAAKADVNFTV